MSANWRNDEFTQTHWHLRLFNKSLLKKAKWKQIRRMLGPPAGKTCLDIGADNGVISYLLRQEGGRWHSADISEKAVDSIRSLVGERVDRIADGRLPYEDETFDTVVIIDMLEHMENDYGFIRDCHRVLKPAGQLIVNVPHHKPGALLRPLRNILGLTDEKHGHVRPGYTGQQLFDVLKDGFDVQEVTTYSRFFTELIDTFIQLAAARKQPDASGEKGVLIDQRDFSAMERSFRTYSMVYPILYTASLLDYLLFMTKGYSLIARAKRRLWIPRKIPILADGRSIAEAAINTRIGSAAPF